MNKALDSLKNWGFLYMNFVYYRHLGHDIRVHREYYRLQESTLELAKVSRLLLAVNQGNVRLGTRLADIDVTGG